MELHIGATYVTIYQFSEHRVWGKKSKLAVYLQNYFSYKKAMRLIGKLWSLEFQRDAPRSRSSYSFGDIEQKVEPTWHFFSNELKKSLFSPELQALQKRYAHRWKAID